MFAEKKEEPKMLSKIFKEDETNVVTTADVTDLAWQNFWHKLKAFLYITWPSGAIHSLLMTLGIGHFIGWKKLQMTGIYFVAKGISIIAPDFEMYSNAGYNARQVAKILGAGVPWVISKLIFLFLLFSPVYLLSIRRYNKNKAQARELQRKKHLRGKQVVEAAYVLEDMIAEGIHGTLPIGCTVETYGDPNTITIEKQPTALSLLNYRKLKDVETRKKIYYWISGTQPKRVLPKRASKPYVNDFDSFWKHFYDKSIKLPTLAETEGVLFVGAPGTGKGQLMNPIVHMTANWEKYGPPQDDGSPAKPARNVYLDGKGDEYFCKVYRPERDILLNFCDVRGEVYLWNFLDEQECQLVTDCEAIAESLIPEMPKVEPFWRLAPRAIFKGLMLWCIKNNKRTLSDLYQACCVNGITMQKYLNETEGAEGARRYLEDPTSKMCQSVLSCLAQEVECLSLISKRATKEFHIDEWLDSEDGGSVFLQYPKSLRAVLRGYYTVFIDTLARKILSKTSDLSRRMFFFLDEFPTLNKCPSILEMLNQGRSKGCCLFIGIQSLAQIKSTYGEEDMHALIGGCGTKVIFNLGENFSGKYFAEFFDKQDAMKTKIGYTVKVEDEQDAKQVSLNDEERFVLKSGELTNIPRWHAFLMLRNVKHGHDLCLVQFPIVALPNKPDVPMLILRDDLYLKNRYNLKNIYQTSEDLAKENQLEAISRERGVSEVTETDNEYGI
jgi:type IV secretion system coupling TraD/TrwB family protein